MSQQLELGASTRLDWFTLSANLEAVFVAARRLSAVARLQAAELGHVRDETDPRRVREVWNDANHVVATAVADLNGSVERLRSTASAMVGLALDASEVET